MRLKIIGVGSPFGADRVGWWVAEGLLASAVMRDAFGEDWMVVTRDRPGVALLSESGGAECVVLIDAMRCDDEPGRVRRLSADDVVLQRRLFSSHGFGVAEALSLGLVLGDLPDRLLIYGIGVPDEGLDVSDDQLTAIVGRAVRCIETDLALL